jgi:hypothetical protein
VASVCTSLEGTAKGESRSCSNDEPEVRPDLSEP